MKTIWKYEINTCGVTEIKVPMNAEILHVDQQERDTLKPKIWFLLDPTNPPEVRKFQCFVTGADVEHYLTAAHHIRTILYNGGSYVLHVFETPYT